MNEFTENRDKEAGFKRHIEDLFLRKRTEYSAPQAAPSDSDGSREREHQKLITENQRLQRLLGELLLKNQQLRAELATRERNYGASIA